MSIGVLKDWKIKLVEIFILRINYEGLFFGVVDNDIIVYIEGINR